MRQVVTMLCLISVVNPGPVLSLYKCNTCEFKLLVSMREKKWPHFDNIVQCILVPAQKCIIYIHAYILCMF